MSFTTFIPSYIVKAYQYWQNTATNLLPLLHIQVKSVHNNWVLAFYTNLAMYEFFVLLKVENDSEVGVSDFKFNVKHQKFVFKSLYPCFLIYFPWTLYQKSNIATFVQFGKTRRLVWLLLTCWRWTCPGAKRKRQEPSGSGSRCNLQGPRPGSRLPIPNKSQVNITTYKK